MAEDKMKGANKEGEQDKKKPAGTDNSPKQGGFHHADTRMGHKHSEAIADLEHAVTGSEPPPREDEENDSDAMSRGKSGKK